MLMGMGPDLHWSKVDEPGTTAVKKTDPPEGFRCQ